MKETKSAMQLALAAARDAGAQGEVPVGAVILSANGDLLATSGNQMRALADPTAHAEIQVIRAAAKKLGHARLDECDLYVTLEPCAMCAGAIALARIRRLYYGASDAKRGAVEHGICLFDQPSCHHKPDIYSGFEEEACAALLTDFFKQRR